MKWRRKEDTRAFKLGSFICYNPFMELREVFKFLKKYKAGVLVFALVFGLLGAAVYLVLPEKYIASGTFLVTRSTEPVLDRFSYEGYYSQQTALSYTKTLMGLFESFDTRKAALEKMGRQVDGAQLRKFGREIRVKSFGPQLVTLNVKGESLESAKDSWEVLTNVVLGKLREVSDPALGVSPLSAAPVVYETYRNVFLNVVVGIGLGVLLGVTVFSLKEYLA